MFFEHPFQKLLFNQFGFCCHHFGAFQGRIICLLMSKYFVFHKKMQRNDLKEMIEKLKEMIEIFGFSHTNQGWLFLRF